MIKDFLPATLFGRALLIVVLPTVLIQLVMAYIFVDRHLSNVTRHMAGTLAGEMAFLVREMEMAPHKAQGTAAAFEHATGIQVRFEGDVPLARGDSGVYPEFRAMLKGKLRHPFTVRTLQDDSVLEIRIRLPDQTIRLETTVKRLESRTTSIFLFWMLGVSSLFLIIAVIFLRNQVRPIRRLAEAADNFGRGVDTPGFRPQGAYEVRKAARAFIVMRERIRRQMRTRTEMLAGVSHDLRTPLTRMKLQLAMLPAAEARELEDDVQQMEHMIGEYLDFARGEGPEDAVPADLRALLEDVVLDYHRLGADVTLQEGGTASLALRPGGFRRMMHNLIDNALRYGKRCALRIEPGAGACEIVLEDEGPGIPEDRRDEVFKPFNRLDASRNSKTGGVGLGLTIARDIVLAHGGSIALGEAPSGGLRVTIRLPV